MKRILIMLFTAVALVGCSKQETDLTFDAKPEERMNEILSDLKSTLVGAPDGWVVGMETGSKGGYGFYMEFSEDDKVSMYSDVNEEARSVPKSSTYRLKWGSNASLIFDTYNYLTLLQDPQPSVSGGAAGKGFLGDIEYNLDHISGDSVIFKGKKYNNALILVKASKEEKALYKAGDYKTRIANVTSFFTKNAFTKLTIADQVYQVSFDLTTKSIAATSFTESGSSTSSAKFFFTLNTMELIHGLEVGNTFIKKFMLDSSGNLFAVDKNDQKIQLTVENTPIFPFELYFKYNGVYNSIYTEGPTMVPGVTSGFNALWASQIENYRLNNVTMVSMTFKLVNSTQAKLEVWFLSGTTRYLADASYDYAIEGNNLKLSNYVPSVSNGNWNGGWVIKSIKDYFENAEFEIKWAESSVSKSAMIGSLVKKGTPTSFYYGNVKKQ